MRIFGYIGKRVAGEPGRPRVTLTDWHGKVIGAGTEGRCWRTPRSHVSTTMCQYEFVVDGKRYTGRSAGEGMVFSGKLKTGKRRR
jgi:hypothetical protein